MADITMNDIQSKLNELNEKIKSGAEFQKDLAALKLELDGVKAAQATPVFSVETAKANHAKAVDEYMKTLLVAASQAVAPAETLNGIIQKVDLYNPIRQNATIINTNAASITVPTESAAFSAEAHGEDYNSGLTDVVPTLGAGVTIALNSFSAAVPVSQYMLRDSSAVNMEQWLTERIAQRIGLAESVGFTTGAGTAGLSTGMFKAEVFTHLHAGSTSAITYDNLADLIYKVPAVFRYNAKFLMNAATLGYVRKLKDDSKRPLVETGFQIVNGNIVPQEKVCGFGVIECPSAPAMGTDATPIVFADVKNAYMIAQDAAGVQLIRDPYTNAATGVVRLIGSIRSAGAVVNAEAGYQLIMSA
jgi:HK97 family phage major capsid protein